MTINRYNNKQKPLYLVVYPNMHQQPMFRTKGIDAMCKYSVPDSLRLFLSQCDDPPGFPYDPTDTSSKTI